MKTKLFLFIFLLSAIITGCDNNVAPEEEKIPEVPVDTTVVNPPDTIMTWSKKMSRLYADLQSIPVSEMVRDYDYPSFISDYIANYEAITTSQETLRDVIKRKIFAGELDNGERRFIQTNFFASCWLCYYYDENGENVSSDNTEDSGKSPVEVKNWKLIYFWGYYGK